MQAKDISHLECPISHAIMLDPVTDKSGEIYEREEIEAWFNECKKNNKPFTSPSTNEELKDDSLITAKTIIKQVKQFLEDHPERWADAYVSNIAHDNFKKALQAEKGNALEVLVKQEPRFLTIDNFALIHWVFTKQDSVFLKNIVIPNLFHRGQESKFLDIILLAAEKSWQEGLRLLIETKKWTATDYFSCVKTWLYAKKTSGMKALLHEIQYKQLDINTIDAKGNTLLHDAVLANNIEMVTLLLVTGIDSKIKNQDGLTSEELAAQRNDKAIIQAFKDFQASNAPVGAANHQQIKALQTEIQELKYQLADVKAQNKKEMGQLFKGLRYAGSPIFTSVKQKTYKK